MTSFSSSVLMDIVTTRASGLANWMPAFSGTGDTRPKRSTTPTEPAGMTRTERPRTSTITISSVKLASDRGDNRSSATTTQSDDQQAEDQNHDDSKQTHDGLLS